MRRSLIITGIIGMFALCVSAQESQLGRVEFPTSGSPEAQQHFLRGLAALHSFWYEEAIEAFRESTKVEPDFAMGYRHRATSAREAQRDSEADGT
jgi:hypothetical protein